MPEYPDVVVYVERLEALVKGQVLQAARIAHPFLLRTAEPPVDSIVGSTVLGVGRIGKRIVFTFPEERFLVLHLMIAGRLQWCEPGRKLPGKRGLAALDFPSGSLLITEAGSKKRASLHLVRGQQRLEGFDRGGLEVFAITIQQFRERLLSENHTLKRALTDPRLFSGIGNAYSDEILHRARLSPVLLTGRLADTQIERLFAATRQTLREWTERLRAETGDGFPKKVTAFRDEMAVHGKYGRPCPSCGAPVQRIRYSRNETNYCPRCQTGGKLLADRSLSRLLKKDWPRSLEELETRRQPKS